MTAAKFAPPPARSAGREAFFISALSFLFQSYIMKEKRQEESAMKRVLLVNGSPHPKGNTFRALSLVAKGLEQKGVEVEWFHVGTDPVRPCVDCRRCTETLRCFYQDDKCNALIEAIERNDGLIIGTPTYFAGPNGALCALLDRAFYCLDEFGHKLLGKPAAGVAVCWRSGTTAALDRLNKYFTHAGMYVVSSLYWNNLIHGEGDLLEDSYGMEMAGILAEQMAGLLEKLD